MRKALSMVFAVVLTMPFLSLLSGAMTEKTLYADMPVEWAVSYDPRTDASDLVPESDNKALPFHFLVRATKQAPQSEHFINPE